MSSVWQVCNVTGVGVNDPTTGVNTDTIGAGANERGRSWGGGGSMLGRSAVSYQNICPSSDIFSSNTVNTDIFSNSVTKINVSTQANDKPLKRY